jgi:hypothetical protein
MYVEIEKKNVRTCLEDIKKEKKRKRWIIWMICCSKRGCISMPIFV